MSEAEPARADLFSLVVATKRRRIDVPAGSPIYLGRCDEIRGIYPDIDFTDDDGVALGVSRRHARIHRKEIGVFIEDLGSTNGTFVNGQRLVPHTLLQLFHGDVIELGRFKLIVSLPPRK